MNTSTIIAIIVIVLIAIILLVIFVFPSEKITEIRISPVTKFTKDEATNNLAKANQEKLLQKVYDFAKLNNIPVVPKVFSGGYINWVTNKGSDKTIEFTETFLIHGYLQALYYMGNIVKPGSMQEPPTSYDSKLVL